VIPRDKIKEEERRLHDSHDRPDLLLIGILVAGVLAMVATWFVVAYFPIPDDDAIHLGLLGFFFVLVIDVFLVYEDLRDAKLQGQRVPAIRRSVKLLLLGLLVAAIVGSLPWLWFRLWSWLTAAMPWLPDILEELLILAFLLNLIAIWRRRRARKASL
jgi:hypothetical protein